MLAGLARLVREKGRKDSLLNRITGRKMLLEYDIDPRGDGPHPAPGAFLYPTEKPLYGRNASRRLEDLGVVLDGVAATGWDWDAGERRQVERLFLALQPEARILSLGAFPCRTRGVRLAVTGFKTSGEVMTFLQRAGWPWPPASVEATLAHLKPATASAPLRSTLTFDRVASAPSWGWACTLGTCPAAGRAVLAGRTKQLDCLYRDHAREAACRSKKLAALENWSSGAELLFGRSGRFVLVRGVHHVKARRYGRSGRPSQGLCVSADVLARAGRGDARLTPMTSPQHGSLAADRWLRAGSAPGAERHAPPRPHGGANARGYRKTALGLAYAQQRRRGLKISQRHWRGLRDRVLGA